MKTCSRCNTSNPDHAKYCLQCGTLLGPSATPPSPRKKNFIHRIPVLGWIFIGLAAIALGLGAIIGSFWAVGTVSGVASIVFLIIGFIGFGVHRRGTFTSDKFFRAIAIGFYALMGASIDQTGNYLYNLPIEKIECPQGTTLNRRADVNHPYAGSTVITQDFSCYNELGEREDTISSFGVMGYRLLEYIIIAYIFIGIRWLLHRFSQRRSASLGSPREII
jgi:amino acid transporter